MKSLCLLSEQELEESEIQALGGTTQGQVPELP